MQWFSQHHALYLNERRQVKKGTSTSRSSQIVWVIGDKDFAWVSLSFYEVFHTINFRARSHWTLFSVKKMPKIQNQDMQDYQEGRYPQHRFDLSTSIMNKLPCSLRKIMRRPNCKQPSKYRDFYSDICTPPWHVNITRLRNPISTRGPELSLKISGIWGLFPHLVPPWAKRRSPN